MFNKVILVGNITNAPELKYTPSGVAICIFRMAVNRPFAGASGVREADFIDIVAWRQDAEFAANFMEKGRLVLVEGRLQIRSYDAQDGTRRRVAEVVASSVQGMDRPKKTDVQTAAEAEFPDPFNSEPSE